MVKLTLKQVKEELEKKVTLDDKRTYLEEVLKKIKGKKLREAVEKLLAEAKEHLQHEDKFATDKLEQKLVTEIPAPELEAPRRRVSFGEMRRPTEETASPLEQQVRAAAPTVEAGWRPEKVEVYSPIRVAGGQYMLFGDAAEKAMQVLSDFGMVRKFSQEQFRYLGPAERKNIFETVSAAVGGAQNYEQLNRLVEYVTVRPEAAGTKKKKEEPDEQKYTIRPSGAHY